jgi:hypothetical protein
MYGHIWLYNALDMAKGNSRHIYLNKVQELVLDAISAARGKRRLDVEPTRSQLIFTAVRNFIEDCEAEEDLREAIKEARVQLAAEKKSPRSS